MMIGLDMEDGFNIEIGGGYSLNYEEILAHKESLAVTRLLASDIMKTGYINVGQFIKELSDADLMALTSKMEIEEDTGEPDYADLILISEMLATGEGCSQSATPEEFGDRMNQLVMLLTIESLARKGLVKVYYENISFHEDMGDKKIVEAIK